MTECHICKGTIDGCDICDICDYRDFLVQCAGCNGIGESCQSCGRELDLIRCPVCDGTGESLLVASATACDECSGEGWLTEAELMSVSFADDIFTQFKKHHPNAKSPSEKTLRCYHLLCRWLGGPNWASIIVEDFAILEDGCVKVSLTRGFSMSTHDGDDMTTLVFLAHDLRIRAQVLPFDHVRLALKLEPMGSGESSILHPSIDGAIYRHRQPKESRL